MSPFIVFCKQDPIKDYKLPIKTLMNWFETIVVTKKREDIVNLIKSLLIKNNRNVELPEIQLPTENGKLIALPDFTEEHGDFEDDDTEHTEVFYRPKYDFHLLWRISLATC